jgi:hypothetical protein
VKVAKLADDSCGKPIRPVPDLIREILELRPRRHKEVCTTRPFRRTAELDRIGASRYFDFGSRLKPLTNDNQ